ncbi:Kinase A inhibitor [compost metagenome]
MIGFAPGFPYLGGMNEKIASPRKEVPSANIPAGSVGIAGIQTGIYPIETPGGWQIIGQTPLKLFDVNRNPPALIKAGNKLRFVAITEDEFDEMKREYDGD